jgi:hypothetical protein
MALEASGYSELMAIIIGHIAIEFNAKHRFKLFVARILLQSCY